MITASLRRSELMPSSKGLMASGNENANLSTDASLAGNRMVTIREGEAAEKSICSAGPSLTDTSILWG